MRELRSYPVNCGSATAVESCFDQEADDICNAFLRSLKYTGLCEIELKRDTRDGRLRMIETNPRYSGTGDAATYAGVDMGWLHYLDLIGIDVKPVAPLARSFRHIVLFQDISTLPRYRRLGMLTWRSLFKSYRPPIAFYDVNLRDWRVFAITSLRFARNAIASILRRVCYRQSGDL